MDVKLIGSAFEPDDEPGNYTRWSTIALRAFKAHSIEILRDSPSAERKFFRWEVYGYKMFQTSGDLPSAGAEEGTLEVWPDTSLEGYVCHQ